MRYNTLIVVIWLITPIFVCLMGCEDGILHDPSANVKVKVVTENAMEVVGVGEYKGFIANNSSRVLKIVCPYDEDISWELKPQGLIKLCLESKEYTFRAYRYAYVYPPGKDVIKEFNSITFLLNTVKDDVMIIPSFVCIAWGTVYSFDRNFRDNVVKEENKALITHECEHGQIVWYPSTGKIWLLYETRMSFEEWTTEFEMIGIVKEEIYDWGVIFWDDKVEYRP